MSTLIQYGNAEVVDSRPTAWYSTATSPSATTATKRGRAAKFLVAELMKEKLVQ